MTHRSMPGRLWRPSLLLLSLASLALAAPARAATYTAGFEERTLVGNLTGPTAVAWTPDGRMLVAEKAGKLKVVAPGGTAATQILDISAKVNSYWDPGLLGIAVDSSFLANRYVYLLCTYELTPSQPDQSGQMVSRLTRIQLNADNTVSPETTLLGSYASGPDVNRRPVPSQLLRLDLLRRLLGGGTPSGPTSSTTDASTNCASTTAPSPPPRSPPT